MTLISMSNGKGCVETIEKLQIVVTNHLEHEVELLWQSDDGRDPSPVGNISPGEWIKIDSHHAHCFACGHDLCSFCVHAKRTYYDICVHAK